MPPPGDSYACLAAIETALPGAGAQRRRAHAQERERSEGEDALELRLRVDPERSDPYGWVGALEVARESAEYLRMPLALAPGQPLFWALSGSHSGRLTLRAAPAGYRLASVSAPAGAPAAPIRAISLGSDAAGSHPLNGLTGGAHLTP